MRSLLRLRRLPSVLLTSLLGSSVMIGAIVPIAPAQTQLTVFDPSNYSQNLLTAARTLQQVNNQIKVLQNQAQSLINQAHNLSTIGFPELQAIISTMQQINQLMGQAQGVQFRVTGLEQQFRALFPTSFSQMLTNAQHAGDARTRMNTAMAGFEHTMRMRGQLGEDVAIQTERGSRTFAAGDRVMFLKNERGLGVKNGSLGIVESVSSVRMTVMLDDGRNVAFDLKDYTQIDHGFAATIHKAQGMTVHRVHVLATPGLDRHAAYVALSRHRDHVHLHYGHDDFADQGKLVRTLSRERGKDMASDYQREPSLGAPDRPPTSPTVAAPARQERGADPALPAAVARHASIIEQMRFSRSVGDPYTAEQRTELASSRAMLDTLAPQGARDLEAALASDTQLIGDAAKGRTQAAIRTMQLEAAMRADPQLRADTFVQRRQALDRQRRLLVRDHEDSAAGRVVQTMAGMAKSLERDPQLESILRRRRKEFGLPAMPGKSLGQSLADTIGIGRGRGIGIGI